MKSITIGFSRPTNEIMPIGSWLIRAFQGTTYSHVYLKFHSESLNRDIVYEAVGRGVRFVGNLVWGLKALEVASFTLQVKECNQIYLMQHCVDTSGLNYGYLQNIGVILAKVLGLKKNPWHSGKNCSEVIAEVLELEGYVLPKESNLMTPKDIYELLSK